jgi:hypothetical protein
VRALNDAWPVPSPPASFRQICVPGVLTCVTGVVPSLHWTMVAVVPAGLVASTCSATGWAQFDPSTVKATRPPAVPVPDAGLMARLGAGCGAVFAGFEAAATIWL